MADQFDESAVRDLASRLVPPHWAGDGTDDVSVADQVAGVLREGGWQVHVTDQPAKRQAVIAELDGGSPGRTLMLQARVTADRNGGLVALILAARAVQSGGFAGRLVIGVAVSGEGPGLGVTAFASSPLTRDVDGVVVAAPTDGEVYADVAGILRLAINFRSDIPSAAHNPVIACGPLLVGLAEVERQLRSTSVGGAGGEAAFALTPTVLTAGSPDDLDVVPTTATVLLTARTVPGMSHQGLARLLGGLADQVATEHELSSDLRVLDDLPASETEPETGVVAALVNALASVTGLRAAVHAAGGERENATWATGTSAPTAVYGPGAGRSATQSDTQPSAAEIVVAARVYAMAARAFLTS